MRDFSHRLDAGKLFSTVLALVCALMLTLPLYACGIGDGTNSDGYGASDTQTTGSSVSDDVTVSEDGTYTGRDEVASYIHLYGHLPSNFISKTKARAAGWDSESGNLDEVCPGMSIGGSDYHDYDGKLPDAPGRSWKECDIDYDGGYRGAKRLIFSNDGLIFYTDDHYETFTQLY